MNGKKRSAPKRVEKQKTSPPQDEALAIWKELRGRGLDAGHAARVAPLVVNQRRAQQDRLTLPSFRQFADAELRTAFAERLGNAVCLDVRRGCGGLWEDDLVDVPAELAMASRDLVGDLATVAYCKRAPRRAIENAVAIHASRLARIQTRFPPGTAAWMPILALLIEDMSGCLPVRRAEDLIFWGAAIVVQRPFVSVDEVVLALLDQLGQAAADLPRPFEQRRADHVAAAAFVLSSIRLPRERLNEHDFTVAWREKPGRRAGGVSVVEDGWSAAIKFAAAFGVPMGTRRDSEKRHAQKKP